MQVGVRFVAYLSQETGAEQVAVTLPESARVADLIQQLGALYPAQAGLLARAAYLVDNRSAPPETPLSDGAQVLALMVLSGGASNPEGIGGG